MDFLQLIIFWHWHRTLTEHLLSHSSAQHDSEPVFQSLFYLCPWGLTHFTPGNISSCICFISLTPYLTPGLNTGTVSLRYRIKIDSDSLIWKRKKVPHVASFLTVCLLSLSVRLMLWIHIYPLNMKSFRLWMCVCCSLLYLLMCIGAEVNRFLLDRVTIFSYKPPCYDDLYDWGLRAIGLGLGWGDVFVLRVVVVSVTCIHCLVHALKRECVCSLQR